MDFWQSFWPGFAATIAGVILGIPAALAIERLIEARAQRALGRARAERRQRAVGVLIVRLGTNIFALDDLAARIENGEVPLTSLMESSTWRTVRRSLDDLPDLDLLGGLAMLFTRIDELQRPRVLLEQQFFAAAAALQGRNERQAALKGVIIPVARDVATKAKGMRDALTRFR